MAILKGVRASVHVAGQALFEYNPDADLPIDNVAQNETTRYIECRGGVQFEIRAGPAGLPDPRLPMFGLLSDVFVDGSLICTLFTSPGQPMRCKGSQYWKEGVRYLRRFEFADIRTTEDTPTDPRKLHLLAGLASKIGTITVKMWRTSNHWRKEGRQDDCGLGATQTFPEKALKGSAVSHTSSLRPPELGDQYSSIVGVTYIDPRQLPYAIFHFKYRSRRALQIEGLIPRDPSPPAPDPPPTAAARDPLAGYSSEELRRILKERDKAESPSAKKEPPRECSTKARRTSGIKREPESDVEFVEENQCRNRRASKHEAIDLSED